LNIVTCLLNRGARVNLSDKEGAFPLHVACAKGHPGVVSLLCVKDKHLQQLTMKRRATSGEVVPLWKGSKIPMEIAIEHGHLEVVEIFSML